MNVEVSNYLNITDSLCYDSTLDERFHHCKSTDYYGKECQYCLEGYYLSSGDKRCGKAENCKYFGNEERCQQCNRYYCLNSKNGLCYDNDYMAKEEDKIYIACLYTNNEGTACEKCLNGYEIGENGYCVDVERCEKKENGICVKCIDDDEYGNFYCANSLFGCLETSFADCLKCDDWQNLYYCTEYYNEMK